MHDVNARRVFPLVWVVAWVAWGMVPQVAAAQDSEKAGSAREYSAGIQPLLKRYCHECHSGELTEAEVDLGVFKSVEDVRTAPQVWVKVRGMLESGQMPPKDAPQPADTEMTGLKKWVRGFLAEVAQAEAGDPGPVVLRRLSNAEYTYSIRDLTGVDSLSPTNEFPVDGAAGEGFTNSGSGQGMSPALVQKYLDAAKGVAEHVVLLQNGIRFSPQTSRRDRTDAALARIQAFYGRFTHEGGGQAVNLQGIKFDTNRGGRLPLKQYLEATLVERDALRKGEKTIAEVAQKRSLSARYLGTLWEALNGEESSSFLLGPLRKKWREAKAEDAAALAAEIAAAQDALWKFNSIGQFGKEGGPQSWMEPVSPVVSRQELRLPLGNVAEGEVVVYLAASDLGDGNADDIVQWERPRIEFKEGKAGAILLRDVRGLTGRIEKSLAQELPRTSEYLHAVAESRASSVPLEKLAAARKLNAKLLEKWAGLVRLGSGTKPVVAGRFAEKLTKISGYEDVNGWGSHATPILLTNRAEMDISFLTLTVPARGVTVHPSPTEEAFVSWQSPLDGTVRIEGLVADSDDKCGNGAAFRLEVTTKTGRTTLAESALPSGATAKFRHNKDVVVESGDIVSLVVNARDRNHSCDTTHVELKLREVEGKERTWDLAGDVVDHVLEGNPLPDAYGNKGVWHFGSLGEKAVEDDAIPGGSKLAEWRAAVVGGKSAEEIGQLAGEVQEVLTSEDAKQLGEADGKLRSLLLDWKGALDWVAVSDGEGESEFGLEAGQFGKGVDGSEIAEADLCVRAPDVIAVRLPRRLVAGGEFAAGAKLRGAGSVQVRVVTEKPDLENVSAAAPVLVGDGAARERVEGALKQYRELFPPALCYARIVPVDEVVTLRLFYREDDHLRRLMLDDAQAAELERLWDELYFISEEPLQLVVSLEQLIQFATQDRQDLVPLFKKMEQPVGERAAAFRKRQLEAEKVHLEGVLEFADQAWRRALTEGEREELRGLYRRLREGEIGHAEAIQLTVARVLTSPAFLYKLEEPGAGKEQVAVSSDELATRLSYFLWSSVPDAELRKAAAAGALTEEAELRKQTRRMLRDARARRMAVHFACQWLHVRDFDRNDDKNETLYPEFGELRGEMYEETVRFFEDLFRNDGSVLALLDADYTFLNERLAKYYGIGGVTGETWRRVEGVREKGRGGVLGMATVLASQSGASRTSPILRGNWVYETLLGERLPRPPAGVPQLPEEVPSGLTARELIEHHSRTEACARCHSKIDPYGFALEQYDAIGRLRPERVDTKTTLVDGKEIAGIEGLRTYLKDDRRDDFLRQFCRKLLGYALGREVQLSDEPLLDDMMRRLAENEYRVSVAVETVVLGRQFREIRGRGQGSEVSGQEAEVGDGMGG